MSNIVAWRQLRAGWMTRSSHPAALLGILAIGAGIRFQNLGVESLWLDEAVSWMQSKDGFDDVIRRTARDTYPPLHNLFIWLSIRQFGDGEWALRLPSAMFGTANILALYWLGSMTVGRIAALLGAAFLALSGFHVWYSQEARMYAALSLTATLFAASSFYFIRSPTIPRAALVSLSGLAVLYSHPFGTFNWMAIVLGISLLTRTSTGLTFRNRCWLGANAIAASLFAPWAWLLKKVASAIAGNFWTPHPSIAVIRTELNGLFGGRLMGVLLFAGVLLALVPKRPDPRAEETSFAAKSVHILLVWAALPIVMAYAMSLVSTPVFISRYLIGSLPPLLLVAAYGLSRYVKGTGIATTCALSVVAILLTSYARYATAPRENWRGIAAMFHERVGPSDCVVVHAPMEPLNYYFRTELPCLLVPDKSGLDQSLSDISGNRLYFISSHRPKRQAEHILETLRTHGWSVKQEIRFREIEVLEFGRTAYTTAR